jgi:peptidoglycan DL-endopeptidase CwlO
VRKLRRPLGAISVVIVAALAVTMGAGGSASADPTFPTWSDVLKAKQNAAAKKAEIKKLTALIVSLQNSAAAAGKTALERGEEYLEAKSALQQATTTADQLSNQAAAADEKAKASSREASLLAAQLAREGSGDLTLQLVLDGYHASDLLDVLGTINKLGAQSSKLFAQAQQDRKTAKALSDQASIAESDRATKAATAESALAAANAAAATAQSRVTTQTTEQKVLTAQLASLNNVSAATEAEYYAGVAWEAKQAAQKAPPADQVPPGPIPGVPDGSKVATAIQFAEAQLGKPYKLDGAGPTYWDCSGLTLKAYAAAGVYIGTHSATNQYNTLKSQNRLVPLSERQPGDILWYSDGGSTSATKYHVTLYIGNGQMIEAPYPGVNVRIAAVRFGDLVPFAGRPTG